MHRQGIFRYYGYIKFRALSKIKYSKTAFANGTLCWIYAWVIVVSNYSASVSVKLVGTFASTPVQRLKVNDKNFWRICFEKTLNIFSIVFYRPTTYDICSWFSYATYKLSLLDSRFFSSLSLSVVWFSLNPAIVTSSSKNGGSDTSAMLSTVLAHLLSGSVTGMGNRKSTNNSKYIGSTEVVPT